MMAIDMMDIKRNKALSTPYEDAPSSCVRPSNKHALPISQALVKHITIKMTARKLCKRNNVLLSRVEMNDGMKSGYKIIHKKGAPAPAGKKSTSMLSKDFFFLLRLQIHVGKFFCLFADDDNHRNGPEINSAITLWVAKKPIINN